MLEIPAEVEAALARDANPSVLSDAVADVVRRQVETGLDIVNDGEFGKSFWNLYAGDRLEGVEWRPETEPTVTRGRDYAAFPEFYAWALQTPGVLGWRTPAANRNKPVAIGPLSYRSDAVQRDIANLKAAIGHVEVADAFLPAVAPGKHRGALRQRALQLAGGVALRARRRAA